MTVRKGLGVAVAAAALITSPVRAACWTEDEAAAAGIRQLQSMLMVSALRCQAAGQGIMADYNDFVTANAAAIRTENERLRGHFIQAQGAVAGERAYDGFTTSLANGFGAGAGAPRACAQVADLAHEAQAMAGARSGLLLLVARLALDRPLPGGRCAGAIAMAQADRPVAAVSAHFAPAEPLPIAYPAEDPR